MSAITPLFDGFSLYFLAEKITPVTVELQSSESLQTFKICLHSKRAPERFAAAATNEEAAHKALVESGYHVEIAPLLRKFDRESAEGFWDTTIDSLRVAYYGPGEYVQPHYHDIDEAFTIKSGGCSIWISQDGGKSWIYNYYEKEVVIIRGGAWHCLVAGPEGLCMDVFNDHKRSINWLDDRRSTEWQKDLRYIATIQELAEVTELALCSI